MYFCVTRGRWVVKNGKKVRNVICEPPHKKDRVKKIVSLLLVGPLEASPSRLATSTGEGYSKKISNKSPVKTQCISCGKALCTKHRLEICRICANSVAHPPTNRPDRAGDPMQD